MNYLTDKVSIYHCPNCLAEGEEHHWVNDPYIGACCGDCGDQVKWLRDRDAGWWSIGVYETGRSYGGTEEGGWWYDTGSRIDDWHVRGFEDLIAAQKYRDELAKQYENCKDVLVLGFTEKLPVRGFPDRKPVYC